MIEMGDFLIKLVIPAGFEPTACRLGGDRSILLSYETKSGFTRVFGPSVVLSPTSFR